MSSDENETSSFKRRKKVRRLVEESPVSSASTSSGSPIIASSSSRGKRRKFIEDSTDSESSEGSDVVVRRKKVAKVESDSDFSSDDDSSPVTTRRLKKHLKALPSESESEGSDIIVPRRVGGLAPLIISDSDEWETEISDSEEVSQYKDKPSISVLSEEKAIDSDSSDGQSEKCPICLLSFRLQEVGIPESCEHTFCLECIQEWSKNMNTCPVDRKEYHSVTVRMCLNGKVIKKIPIEKPATQEDGVDIIEDPTFCEICGSNDNEDRLLLCDGCDLGFHLYCLAPPLDEVPEGSWYCQECSSHINPDIDFDEVVTVLLGGPLVSGRRRRSSTRLIPRTRQTERVRRQVETNRSRRQRETVNGENRPSTSRGRVNSNRVSSSSASVPRRPKKKPRKSTKSRYKTVWVLDEFGEAVPVKKKISAKKRRSKKKFGRGTKLIEKTVKKRLAAQLGICNPRNTAQSLPDVRVSSGSNANDIGFRRYQAGIPNLDLFGNSNRLDYFSQSEDEGIYNEDEGRGVHTLLARRAVNPTDALRRVVRRKAAVVNIPTVSSSTDILDSIMDAQEKLLSKNSILSVVDSSGKLKIEGRALKDPLLNNNNSPTKPDFNSYSVRETPWHGRNNSGYRPNNRNNWSNNRNWQNNPRYYQGRYGPANNYGQGPSYSGRNYMEGRDQYYNDAPQDYTQRTLCEAEMLQDEEKDKNTPESNNQVDDADVDVYGDIENETVSTSRVDEDFRPPSPPLAQMQTSNTNTDEDNDSESGMVIDTERVPEDSVSSTVGVSSGQVYSPGQPTYSPGQPTYSPGQPSYSPGQPSYSPGQPSYSPGQPSYSPGQPSYSPAQPNYSPRQPTCSPGGPKYSPSQQTYSPEEPTGSPEKHRYSPAEPTDTPEHSEDGPPDAQGVALGYDQLQHELASGYDALQREIASGYDELQREFASGLKAFQPLMDMSHSESNVEEKSDNNEDQPLDTEKPDEDAKQEFSGETIDESETDAEARPSAQLVDDAAPGGADNEAEPEEEKETNNSLQPPEKLNDDDEVSNDGCPNFSIYSRQSKSVALTTDISLPASITKLEPEEQHQQQQSALVPEDVDPITDESGSLPATPQRVTVEKTGADPRLEKHQLGSWNLGGLYSDSEDESVVKKTNSFAISDLKGMTEDILSEEERSYTPVLDEKKDKTKEGLEGLDTEAISDDDRNDFDESHELKTISDGDALEINAKESELEFTRPEEFEEGEIVDKSKEKPVETTEGGATPEAKTKKEKPKTDKKIDKDVKKKKKEKTKSKDSPSPDDGANKENVEKEPFKKLTKSSKDRNYRDKDKSKSKDVTRERSRTKTPEITDKEKEAKKKKEKRKELERYNVRALIAEKPRPPPKDQFGRDLRRSPSRSRSRSYTPPVSPPRVRRTPSPIRAPTPISRRDSRSVSRGRTPPRRRRSLSKRHSRSRSRDKSGKRKGRSRSRSGGRKRDRSKTKKRKRSTSRSNRRKKSKEKSKKRARRSHSRRRSRSPRSRSPSRSPRRARREWTPSLSRSLTPPLHHMSPSWTPPRTDNSGALRNQNLTVILNNEAAKKKKDKRNRDRRRKDDSSSAKRRRRERDRTPPPSKEVFASGDNILVSVSFNNENETRDVSTRDNRKRKEAAAVEQQKKTREKRNRTRRDLSGVKPVAIIDLERSPFQEIAPSPKDVIVLSDSDNNDTENRNIQNNIICDSSQQVASPEETPNYTMGPKTPPEPSVKFALLPKPPQLRAINNPLHDPLETIEEETAEELNNSSHKGPNTPPEEPPTSPPSSPDAYDPFEPTKSRSPTPEPGDVALEHGADQTQEPLENLDKSGQTPDITKSLTPPMPDIQPADSQSSIQEISEPKSPDPPLSQHMQSSNAKPVGQTIPFSSVQTTIVSSTPASSTITVSRINILSSSVVAPSTIPQRIVLPNQVKSSPVKIPPTKAAVKSTPIKPMQSKTASKKTTKQQNGNSLADDINLLDFDSPYSPGSSDYEDLFEPPIEPAAAAVKPKTSKSSSNKKSTFDALFGSPNYNKKTNKRTSSSVKKPGGTKTKHVGVKIDEDSLKILEELPNSAVEMQVKDKFLKKLNRQERVVEEVKLVLKPYYNKKKITKDEYKDIMRRAVPKICHNKTGEINPIKIRHLVEAYVRKIKHSKKVTSSSSLPQKVV